ncbi:MAG TPA: alpha/beta fold hydrolase [Blastocatellia bacterium]|nr:alpha/beta fold hydrolase [Blastocatellia bacterium]
MSSVALSSSDEIIRLNALADKWRFEPYRTLRNRHLMTIIPSYLPRHYSNEKLPVDSRIIEVDPDQRVLVHCHWQKDKQNRPTVLIVHGMEGSSSSKYALGTADKAFRAGFNAIRYNMRGCGGSEHLSNTLYNASRSGDVRRVVEHLVKTDKIENIFLAGFSLGGNIVLKLAAEYTDNPQSEIRGIFAVSPAIDLHASIQEIMKPANRIYHWNFVFSMRRRMRRRFALYPDLFDPKPLDRIRNIKEFDEIYTAPNGGFANADDYYTRASSKPLLPKIKIPTIIVHAMDDPFIPFSMFDSNPFKGNPWITFCPTTFGAHVGFIGNGGEDYDRFWVEHRVIDFAKHITEATAANM